jgi:hypothetical protein
LDEAVLELQNAIPNPSNETTKIQFISNDSETISFEIINLLGETISFSKMTSQRGVNDIHLNTSEFSEGIYIYSISNGRIKSSKRLVVNH